uniref:Plexin B2 n=1 Tax=Nomascus leucogenys TaxID=61853 RepID=G1QII8_NOMLE
MALQLWALTLLGLLGAGASLRPRKLDFFRSEKELNHLAVDEASGVVYLGAVNALYQLDAKLQLEQQVATGPALDNKKCTPPIEASQCHEAEMTDNVNQLLLLDPPRKRLVECGSLFKGICALRALSNISLRLFYEDGSGEKSFVASNDEGVATVGLVSSTGPSGDRVLFVGKGNGPHDNGIIVSTRLLDRTDSREAFEAYTDHATYKAGYLSTNTQQFVAAFEDGPYVFFVFNQQDKHPARNRTLLARMCREDPNYYSYLEMDLQCRDPDVHAAAFGTCLAASVAAPGSGRVLYAVFSRDSRSSGGPGAGLCLFPLDEVHAKMEANRNACYTGTSEASRDIFYKPFHGEILCGGHALVWTSVCSCGARTAASVCGFAWPSRSQVYLTPNGTSSEYDSILVEINKRVKRDLVLSGDLASLYVFRLPVQECLSYLTCTQCRDSQDPYCGWCVVEGRCTRKSECPRAEEASHWLWSRSKSCVAVTSAQPQNMSRRAQGEVQLTVSPLPALSEEDKLLCLFGESPPHPARVEGEAVTCNSPSSIPVTPPGQDHVAVTIQLLLRQGNIFLTSYQYPFYDCRQAMSLEENLPCISCVSNRWTCQWDLRYHECREASPNPEDGIIRAHMEDSCPQFLGPSPLVIPMNHETDVTFQGKNLDTVKGSSLHVGSDLLKFMEPVSVQESGTFVFRTPKLSHDANETLPLHLYVKSYGKNIDSKLHVTLYNCSFGRSDCSLCQAANPDYRCAWCGGQSRCVYEALCNTTSECPPPVITRIQPETGPLGGGIHVTILGSNLGVRAGDIRRISVAGRNCSFQPERYSVSTRIVCVIEAAEAPFTGGVEVDVFGKLGRSPPSVQFTFQQPQPLKVEPQQGPQAGGTTLTIHGTHLDTGSQEDVRVTLNGVPCKVWVGALTETMSGPEGMMDGHRAPLRTENFTGGVKKQVNKLIHARGTNLNKAMTLQEAEAFVGAERCTMKTLTETDLYCEPPEVQPPPKRRQKRDTTHNLPEFIVKFGSREWVLGRVEYDTRVSDVPLSLILPLVIVPMVVVIAVSVYCYWRKSQQAEREYEKIKSQLEGLEESVRDRCKKEFTDLMIEMEDQTNDVHEAGIPVLDYKTYTDRVFFLPSKDGDKDVMITGKLDIPEPRRPVVEQALNQFSNLLNSKSFLINFIHTLENQREFSARAKVYFASLLTVALHGKLEYYTDIMRTLFLELLEQYVVAKNPKLMLRRSETVVERMLSNWMSICLYQHLKPLYKLFKPIKHQVEKGPVDAVQKKAKYTLNDTGLLGDDVEYAPLMVSVIVQDEGVDAIPVKVLNCDTISQVKEKIIDQVYRGQPCSCWPRPDSVVLEWRPGSTAQILSDLDLTSQREGRWKRVNTLMHYNVRDGATLILSKVGVSQQPEDSQQDLPGERHALLEEENRVWHLVRPTDEVDEGKSKRGSVKEKERTKAITEIYLTRLLSVKVGPCGCVVPPAVKYFFDFLDEQAEKHNIQDEDTIHIWKTNSLPLRFWVNILKNPHFIFDVHVHEVVDASLSVIAQTFMDACTRTEHKLSRDSPSNKLLYAKEISTYKKMVEDYYKGIRQMVQVSDQDMNTHLAEISRAHTDSLNTLVALHQLYQYTQKYYDEIINALEEDPAAQKMQLAFRLQQIAAALENKVTDL